MKRKRQEEERDVKERMQYTQTDRREREKETKEEERDVKETIQYTQTHTEERKMESKELLLIPCSGSWDSCSVRRSSFDCCASLS